MAREYLKPLVALALITASITAAPAVAQTYDDAPAAETANGTGLLIGALVTLAALAIIFFHDELFDGDEDDEPASP